MAKIIYFFLIFNFSFFTVNIRAEALGSVKVLFPDTSKKIIKYGLASFYAKKFHGRTTSNGATFSSIKMTAACNVIPMGSRVKVTNLRNGKSVVVVINDHLHRKTKRLIDLSKTAAQKLDFISYGITRVKVEVLGRN